MLYSDKEVLSQVNRFKSEGKYREALEVLNKFEDREGQTIQEQLEIHHLKSSLLFELGYMNKALKYAELAYRESKKLKNKFQIVDILLTKISILNKSEKPNEALEVIKTAEKLLKTINQTSSKEFKERKAYLTLHEGGCYFNIGELNHSLKCANEVLNIAEKIKNKKLTMLATKLTNFNNYYKGEVFQNLESIKTYMTLAEELDDKQEIIGALNSIGMYFTEKGDFEKALGYLERGLVLCDEINSFKRIVILSSLFDLYLNMNSLEKAQECQKRMEQLANQTKFDPDGSFYNLSKAILLKRKPQKINHFKAKKILKQIIDVIDPFSGVKFPALIELCDLYLTELRESNDLKVLDELKPYLTKLRKIAKDQQAFWLLVEVLLLQAKLKLICFQFQKAEMILNQAWNISEKYGLSRLLNKIMNEQEEFSNNFMKWKRLKETEASISERMDLANIGNQIEILLQKRRYLQIINKKLG